MYVAGRFIRLLVMGTTAKVMLGDIDLIFGI
jgi:hypothetical protein